MANKRNYKKRGGAKKKVFRQNRQRKMVTGQEPSFVEQLASGAGAVAKLATAVLPAIMAINTEHKYYDETASVSASVPGTNDVLVSLTNSISRGTLDTNRIGSSILAKDIQIRLAMSLPITSASVPPVVGAFCRLMLIAWKDDDSQNVPTIAKLFQSPTNLYSPVNKDSSDSFVILKDKFFCLNAGVQTGATSTTECFTSMKIFKPLNWHMRWTAADATTQNHVYLLIRSSTTAANPLGITYYSRLNFTDN